MWIVGSNGKILNCLDILGNSCNRLVMLALAGKNVGKKARGEHAHRLGAVKPRLHRIAINFYICHVGNARRKIIFSST